MANADPRVRAEAVATAAKIAKDKATPYLVQGMEDDNPTVRTRAASLAATCPTPRVLESLLHLLQPRFRKDEPEGVQLTATLALGQFDEDAARDTLLQILQPRHFSPFGKKSDEVRAAAITALARFLDNTEVQEAIQQAFADRGMTVRQTAQRIWAQYQARNFQENG